MNIKATKFSNNNSLIAKATNIQIGPIQRFWKIFNSIYLMAQNSSHMSVDNSS